MVLDFLVCRLQQTCFDRHVLNVCNTCFFWLRQLRRVHRSLDVETVKTLVHAVVASRVAAWWPALAEWLFLRGCSTSSPWWSIVVFSAVLQDISPTTVRLCLKYELPGVVNCLFHMFAAAHLEAALSLSPDQQSGLEFTVRSIAGSSCCVNINI